MDASSSAQDWVLKAEGDFAGAVALLKAYEPPFAALIAFHCQQAAEKYLKAVLTSLQVPFPRVHDLVELADLISRSGHGLSELHNALLILAPYAVNVRYPGDEPTESMARAAIEHFRQVRARCRDVLCLPRTESGAVDDPPL